MGEWKGGGKHSGREWVKIATAPYFSIESSMGLQQNIQINRKL